MIELPDFKKAFDYENNFYLSSDTSRIGKILAHYELYKMIRDLPGAIVECGVFKGVSLIRFLTFNLLFGGNEPNKIIGFDVFSKFPHTNYEPEKEMWQKGINAAGECSISRQQLMQILRHKELDKNVELVEGDITKTIPAYIDSHPDLKISLLNLDVDLYEPSVVILKCLYPRVAKEGVILLDDYGIWPGETKAVDEYFKDKNIKIRKFDFSATPHYIIKE